MRESAPTPSHEQKEAALNAVLESEAFARCDQLKSFLRYVCELEIAGRGDDIKEYLIGVEALGRPDDYSPGDDSAVRSRAYALRRKLQEFYDHEMPDASIRIELPKGAYRPRFVECTLLAKSGGAADELAILASSLPIPSVSSFPSRNASVMRGRMAKLYFVVSSIEQLRSVCSCINCRRAAI